MSAGDVMVGDVQVSRVQRGKDFGGVYAVLADALAVVEIDTAIPVLRQLLADVQADRKEAVRQEKAATKAEKKVAP